jgi:hypothetical protein
VIALVKHAKEDGSLKTVSLGEIFKLSGRADHPANITDEDVDVSTLVYSTFYHID